MSTYAEFLAAKRVSAKPSGFEVSVDALNPKLFDWQARIAAWSVRRGCSAVFADCGLGKTLMQLAWANAIVGHTGGRVLILCPLAVAQQTVSESAKFGFSVPIYQVWNQSDVKDGISIANYERLHLLEPAKFVGVVLDESSILKSFTGSTKRQLCESFATAPYRLCCTATPAPNDQKELGNHAQFLGIMESREMLARWFINDTMKAGGYRLTKHGRKDFWRWVASWAVCISHPRDLGCETEGFDLPKLNVHEHILHSDTPPEFLFHPGGSVSATNVHQEKRASLDQKADAVANLVNRVSSEPWAVWVDTDYEADSLKARIPGCVEVRGSQSVFRKESALRGFASGEHRVCITKPQIGGLGLNWQHCCKTTWFASYSYEKFYQAIRRMWRFGQKLPVDVHVFMSESEESISEVVKRKERDHQDMKREMSELMRDGMMEELFDRRELRPYRPTREIEIPSWLKSEQESEVQNVN